MTNVLINGPSGRCTLDFLTVGKFHYLSSASSSSTPLVIAARSGASLTLSSSIYGSN